LKYLLNSSSSEFILKDAAVTPAQFVRLVRHFVAFCREEFGYRLYAYQERIARAVLHALFVEPRDVAITISRQSGKTERVTLLVQFLIIFYQGIEGKPLMYTIASNLVEAALFPTVLN
jgi:hypothetical protein